MLLGSMGCVVNCVCSWFGIVVLCGFVWIDVCCELFGGYFITPPKP